MNSQNNVLIGSNPEYKGRCKAFFMLLKRELWEHPWLVRMPALLAGLAVVGALLSLFAPTMINNQLIDSRGGQGILLNQELGLSGSSFKVELGELTLGNSLRVLEQIPAEPRGQTLNLILTAGMRLMLIVLAWVFPGYIWKALSEERKDKSSLFWKSLPLSAAELVGSKVVVATIIYPLIILLGLLAAALGTLLVYSVASLLSGINPFTLFWSVSEPFSLTLRFAGKLYVDILYFFPFIGFALIASTLAIERKGLLTTALAGGAIMVDAFWFGGGHVWSWMLRHGMPPGFRLGGGVDKEFSDMMGAGMVADGVSFDLVSGVLLGLLLIFTATRLYLLREEK
jgi:ABC-2 type transport system permease protein